MSNETLEPVYRWIDASKELPPEDWIGIGRRKANYVNIWETDTDIHATTIKKDLADKWDVVQWQKEIPLSELMPKGEGELREAIEKRIAQLRESEKTLSELSKWMDEKALNNTAEKGSAEYLKAQIEALESVLAAHPQKQEAQHEHLTDAEIFNALKEALVIPLPRGFENNTFSLPYRHGFYNCVKWMESRQAAPQPPTDNELTELLKRILATKKVAGLLEFIPVESVTKEFSAFLNRNYFDVSQPPTEAEQIAEALADVPHWVTNKEFLKRITPIHRRAVAWKEKKGGDNEK